MNAIKEIQETYTLEEFKEIADHGCQSGVCHKHIYYGDTKAFFGDHEDEIVEYIESHYGTEFLVNLFKDADASLDIYMNNVVWCFIEMIAFEAVEESQEEYALSYAL